MHIYMPHYLIPNSTPREQTQHPNMLLTVRLPKTLTYLNHTDRLMVVLQTTTASHKPKWLHFASPKLDRCLLLPHKICHCSRRVTFLWCKSYVFLPGIIPLSLTLETISGPTGSGSFGILLDVEMLSPMYPQAKHSLRRHWPRFWTFHSPSAMQLPSLKCVLEPPPSSWNSGTSSF